MSGSKRFAVLLLTVSIGLLVGVIAAEVIVRLFHLGPPVVSEYGNYVLDPHIPYKQRPFSVTSGLEEYRHNSAGFRDVEHSLEKPRGTFRILGLGDSFTYGGLASFEASYLSRLETMLNSRAGDQPRVEIIRAGLPRYYPEPERLVLEHYGVAYSPDLVLVGFLPNDVIDTYYGPGAVTVDESGNLRNREAARIGPAVTWLSRRVHLLRLVVQRYVAYRMSRQYRPQWDEIYRADGFHEKDWKSVEAEYTRMVAVAGRLPARLVVVNIPQKGPWTQRHSYPAQRLAAWAEKNGAGFVDALPALQRASGVRPLYHDEGHCTAEGYGVIATAIFEYLTKSGLVP